MRTAEPICPYCHHEQGDAWEWGHGGEQNDTNWCDNCGREFRWSRHIIVSYSTEPIVGPHRLDEFCQKLDAEEFPI